jgi:hypothetical protein
VSILFNNYYSLALIFSKDLKQVVLKNTCGKLDGILVENSKIGIAEQELVIKINQEVGLELEPNELRIITSLQNMNKNWKIDIYMLITDLDKIKFDTNIVTMNINKFENNCHPNLSWLIPLCLDGMVHGSIFNQILMK